MLKETDLHKYQKKAVEHIITHKYCGLFLEMGLGKTVSTLTAVEKLMYDYLEVNSVLVIAPKRVAETVWAEEAQNWEHLQHLTFSKIIGTEKQRLEAFHKKADIRIISRDNIAWLCGICASNLPYDMLVIDELSSFKNHQSQRFKALRLARPWIKRVVGLTGTPAPNGLIDLWPQIYLMDRGERLGKTITKYRSVYFTPGRSNGYVVYNYNLQGGAEQAIRNKIGDICISMQAQDYLHMPMLTNNYVKLKVIPAPNKKKYNREHLAYLVMICILKQTLAISSIVKIIESNLENKTINELYNEFCNIYENVIPFVNMGEPFFEGDDPNGIDELDSDDDINGFILKSAILSTAGKFVCEEMLSAMNVEKDKK